MKIALIGSRGIPARYSGFETFYEQLALRLVERGHAVTVYNRPHMVPDVRDAYRGVRIKRLPSIRTKHLETLSHTFLSLLHALFGRYDIVYVVIVGNSPLVWLARLSGARVLLNVDGEDWAREKWGRFARGYQKACERVAVHTANLIVSDARVIQRRYLSDYGCTSVYVPYGGNVGRSDATEVLARWGLEPRKYLLFVGRLVPENACDLLIAAFRDVPTDMKLVVLGDAPYMDDYKAALQGIEDSRVVFTGYAFGDDYAQLSSHAYLYVLPSGIEGTRPALLDQLAFGNAVLVRDSDANSEVVGTAGFRFAAADAQASLTAELNALIGDPDRVAAMRTQAQSRVEGYYNWDWITEYYEDLFRRLRAEDPIQSYDDFLAARDAHARD